MFKNFFILLILTVVVAVPFILREAPPEGAWKAGDPVLVIVTPHNEAIRYEFERGFSAWHQVKFGSPVKIDWRSIGGTTEIMRYLQSEFTASGKRWWTGLGNDWPTGATEAVVSRSPPAEKPPADEVKKGEDAIKSWEARQVKIKELYDAFRKTDDPKQFTSGMDLFFGGGEIDHSNAARSGLNVPVIERLPKELFTADGVALIPEKLSGETWRTPAVIGTVVSGFGICYNTDRLAELNWDGIPDQWADLADPKFFRQVGLADPTKSGSVSKAFELIIQQRIYEVVYEAGFDDAKINAYEKAIADYIKLKDKEYKRGELPPDVPADYQQAIERGWAEGLWRVQKIGANARYFTDSASKVPIDVSMGDAAVGMCIDFYGRFQAQISGTHAGRTHMGYVTPVGGSSISCDPVSLLRGAPHSEIALRFIEFAISEDGQRLWSYKPGTPGGPEKYALRRLPIRRDFYASTQPSFNANFERHKANAVDDLASPLIDPYQVAKTFTYRSRWTGPLFGIQRELIRVMCIDSADELKSTWGAIIKKGGPGSDSNRAAIQLMEQLPNVELTNANNNKEIFELNWRTAADVSKRFKSLEYVRVWTTFYRENYRKASKAMP